MGRIIVDGRPIQLLQERFNFDWIEDGDFDKVDAYFAEWHKQARLYLDNYIESELGLKPDTIDFKGVLVNKISAYADAIRSFYNFQPKLRKAGGLGRCPVPAYSPVEGRRIREFLTFEQVKQVVELAGELPEDRREPLKAFIAFAFYTGTRADAIFNVKASDFEDLELVTVEEKGPRGQRLIWTKPILPPLKAALKRYFAWLEKKGLLKPELKIFGDLLNPNWVRKWLRQAYKRIGWPYAERKGLKPIHVFRHSFAMWLLRKTGWNYDIVAAVGGWKKIDVLRRNYGRPLKEDQEQLLASLKWGEML